MSTWKNAGIILLLVLQTGCADQLSRLVVSKSAGGRDSNGARLARVQSICSSVALEHRLTAAPNYGDNPGVKKYARPMPLGVGFTSPTIFCAPAQGSELAIITVSDPKQVESKRILMALERALKSQFGAASVRTERDFWIQF